MRNPRQLTAVLSSTVAAGLLFGIPALSNGYDPCAAVPGAKLSTSCSDAQGVVEAARAPAPAPAPAPAQKPAPAAPAPAPARDVQPRATPRQAAADPATTPPLHGTNPHGQGTVAVVDTNPDPTRPYSGDTSPENEDVVVGRARGEQRDDGSYHGHITIVSLFGNEILGVDTEPGQTASGPFDAIQTGFLDALCTGSGDQICLQAARADSSTTDSGSTNSFGVARATIGGANGIDAGVAESNGNISSDGNCQTSHGDSHLADVKAGGQAVASVAKSSSDSKACRDGSTEQTNTSSVIALGGQGVPVPAQGCADGTPDTVTGIPTVAPIVCNADDSNGSQAGAVYGVRDALAVYLLATADGALLKQTTAASESRAVAPGGGNESGRGAAGSGLAGDDDKSKRGGAPASARAPQCSDKRDNDGDGVIDARDPGCHTDGNADNPASYVPSDDSELDGGVARAGAAGALPSDDRLPFTGSDLVLAAFLGALLLAGGVFLRQRAGLQS